MSFLEKALESLNIREADSLPEGKKISYIEVTEEEYKAYCKCVKYKTLARSCITADVILYLYVYVLRRYAGIHISIGVVYMVCLICFSVGIIIKHHIIERDTKKMKIINK